MIALCLWVIIKVASVVIGREAKMTYGVRFPLNVGRFFDIDSFTLNLRRFAQAMGVGVVITRGLLDLLRRRYWITLEGRFEHVNFVLIWIEDLGRGRYRK